MTQHRTITLDGRTYYSGPAPDANAYAIGADGYCRLISGSDPMPIYTHGEMHLHESRDNQSQRADLILTFVLGELKLREHEAKHAARITRWRGVAEGVRP